MSYNINVRTPNKKEIAQVLKAIADDIAVSNNQTITVSLSVTFNENKKKDC